MVALSSLLLLLAWVHIDAAQITVESGGAITLAGATASASTCDVTGLEAKVDTLPTSSELDEKFAGLYTRLARLTPAAPPAFCADSVCGAALLADGWHVLGDFGSLEPARFPGTTSIHSEATITLQGWTSQLTADSLTSSAHTPRTDGMQFWNSGTPNGWISRTFGTADCGSTATSSAFDVLVATGVFDSSGCADGACEGYVEIDTAQGSLKYQPPSILKSSAAGRTDASDRTGWYTHTFRIVMSSTSEAATVSFREDGLKAAWAGYVLCKPAVL